MTTAPARKAAPTPGRVPAGVDPVARLYVDVPLAHLDRPFDYVVPDTLDTQVCAGSRVRVRFAGRLVDAYVLERCATSEHEGRLAFIERAVGAQPVLTAETAALFRAVADRYAGSFVDVARLGVPARHARAETAPSETAPSETAPSETAPSETAPSETVPSETVPSETVPSDAEVAASTDADGFAAYRAGPAFLAAVRAGRPARAVWSALPGEDWAARFAVAARVAADVGRGAVLVVPDARDLARLDAAMTEELGAGRHVALSAELGPAERYRRWLCARRGEVAVVIGTRAAAYAPVADLGLLAIWDDGDDLHADPRAPYPHTRDVLALRSAHSGAALLLGGYARSAEAHLLVESGWAHEVVADRGVVRAAMPRVRPIGDDVEIARDPAAAAARLPSLAWRTTKESLAAGHPVLVQVPRRGYAPSLACARDRTPARCPVCAGPLSAPGPQAVAACRWCGRPAADWSCPTCGEHRLRATVVGSVRTAEELGRAFPGFPVRTSGGDRVLASVPGEPAVVVATPGAEPIAAGGYGAVLLLDGWALLSRPDLRAAEETVRRWLNAAALVRADGAVVVGAEAGVPAVQALVRWDAGGFAARELAERAELGFPPAVRMASLTGAPDAVADLLSSAPLPAEAQVVGPVPAGEDERLLVRVPRARGADLARALKVGAAARSARRTQSAVRIDVDPAELG